MALPQVTRQAALAWSAPADQGSGVVAQHQKVRPAGGPRVFISYAHRDEMETRSRPDGDGLPRRFHKMLVQMVLAMGEEASGVFFDVERLRHEDYWTDAIESALNDCDLFIFLVSLNAMGSPFCLERELQTAASKGKLIVPILLTPTPAWVNRAVPGGAGRKLGEYHSGGLPKDASGNLQAVADWKTPDHAWEAMARDLDAVLSRALTAGRQPGPTSLPMVRAVSQGLAAPAVLSNASGEHRIDAGLLPFFCDQVRLSLAFEEGLAGWTGEAMDRKALLMLVKGVFDDDVESLFRRLTIEHLHPWTRGAQRELSSSVEFELVAEEDMKPDSLRPKVISRLYQALGLTPQQGYEACQSGQSSPGLLEANLASRVGVLNLVTILPKAPLPDCANALGILLEHLGQIRDRKVLGRLSLALFIEQPDLVESGEALAGRLEVSRYEEWVHVVETAAPKPVTLEDVVHWHRQRKIEQTFALSRPDLIAHIEAQGEKSFRLRTFAKLVKPLLGA